MRRLVACISVGLALLMPLFSQGGEFRHDSYAVDIPDGWRRVNFPGAPFHAWYEASGTVLPPEYNNGPVIVTAWIMNVDVSTLREAKEQAIRGYAANPERVFAKGYTHDEEALKLKSGEDAVLLSTRFYRKDKGLDQSRFDLVAFPKEGKGIVYTISIQYADPTYQFEKKHRLKDIVRQLYSSFVFR